jgi:hypothetical protein
MVNSLLQMDLTNDSETAKNVDLKIFKVKPSTKIKEDNNSTEQSLSSDSS